MATTTDRLDEIRARLAAATRGAWGKWEMEEHKPGCEDRDHDFKVYAPDVWGGHRLIAEVLTTDVGVDTGVNSDGDAALIAHAPADLAFLLAEHERLAADRERMRRTLGFFASVIKSGEPWTETCEREYRAAVAAEER